MKLSDRALAWTILTVVGVLVCGALTFWWVRANVIAPSCGDIATSQLEQAMDEIGSKLPNLRFMESGDSCDSGGQVYALWELGDLDQLLTQAVAAGWIRRIRTISASPSQSAVTPPDGMWSSPPNSAPSHWRVDYSFPEPRWRRHLSGPGDSSPAAERIEVMPSPSIVIALPG